MKTRSFTLNDDVAKVINACASILRAGGVVAFPTETVYGLGADAFNLRAVNKVFAAKGRKKDNPLIFHISNIEMLDELAMVPQKARKLIDTFWPGPLTVVLKSRIDKKYTFGLDTIAVRMPDNIIALKLIEELGGPVAAPSANISGRPSATQFGHVLEDFSGKIAAAIDGGATVYGVESTVIDATVYPFVLLRPGAISVEQIRKAGASVSLVRKGHLLKRSPGTRYRHYAPRAKVLLVKGKSEATQIAREYEQKKVGYMGIKKLSTRFDKYVMFTDMDEYARQLFATFRYMDANGMDIIAAELPAGRGMGRAVRDRLIRAAE